MRSTPGRRSLLVDYEEWYCVLLFTLINIIINISHLQEVFSIHLFQSTILRIHEHGVPPIAEFIAVDGDMRWCQVFSPIFPLFIILLHSLPAKSVIFSLIGFIFFFDIIYRPMTHFTVTSGSADTSSHADSILSTGH